MPAGHAIPSIKSPSSSRPSSSPRRRDRVRKNTPEDFWPLLGDKPAGLFQFSEDADAARFSQQIVADIRRKRTADDFVTEVEGPGAAMLGEDKALAVFTATLLQVASKTISHTDTFFSRYKGVFDKLAPDSRRRGVLLASAAAYFSGHPQGLLILVDRLLCLGVIDSDSVVDVRSPPLLFRTCAASHSRQYVPAPALGSRG